MKIEFQGFKQAAEGSQAPVVAEHEAVNGSTVVQQGRDERSLPCRQLDSPGAAWSCCRHQSNNGRLFDSTQIGSRGQHLYSLIS